MTYNEYFKKQREMSKTKSTMNIKSILKCANSIGKDIGYGVVAMVDDPTAKIMMKLLIMALGAAIEGLANLDSQTKQKTFGDLENEHNLNPTIKDIIDWAKENHCWDGFFENMKVEDLYINYVLNISEKEAAREYMRDNYKTEFDFSKDFEDEVVHGNGFVFFRHKEDFAKEAQDFAREL